MTAVVIVLALATLLGLGLTRWLGHRAPDEARLVLVAAHPR